jgi:hypothetical protein
MNWYVVVEFGSYRSKPNVLLLICTKLLTVDILKIVKAIGQELDQAAPNGLLPAVRSTFCPTGTEGTNKSLGHGVTSLAPSVTGARNA